MIKVHKSGPLNWYQLTEIEHYLEVQGLECMWHTTPWMITFIQKCMVSMEYAIIRVHSTESRKLVLKLCGSKLQS